VFPAIEAQVDQDFSEIVGISSVGEKSVFDQALLETEDVKLLGIAHVMEKDTYNVEADY